MIKIKLIEFQYFLSIIFLFFFLNFRNFIKNSYLVISVIESQKLLISNFIGNLLVTTDQF